MLFPEENTHVTRIEMVVTVRTPPERGLRDDYHELRHNHGLVYKLSGQTRYMHGLRETVSRPGSVLYLPRDEAYTVSGDGDCIAVNFQLAACAPHPAIAFEPPESAAYHALFLRLDQHWLLRRSGHIALCTALLYEIIAMLQQHQTAQGRSEGVSQARLKPVQDYLHERYADPSLTVGQLAALAGLSETHLRRLFHEAFGISPMRYVQQVRMNRAADLLRSTGMTVEAVAEAVGYTNPFHFSNAFLRTHGIRPSAFQRRL